MATNNPYSRIFESVVDKVVPSNLTGGDVETLEWTALIEDMLRTLEIEGCVTSIDKHPGGTVHFVLSGSYDSRDVRKIRTETLSTLPIGCTIDTAATPPEGRSHTRVARRPGCVFVTVIVPPRAQNGLNVRTVVSKNVEGIDVAVLVLALVGFIVCAWLLHDHNEGYRQPFETLANIARVKMEQYDLSSIVRDIN